MRGKLINERNAINLIFSMKYRTLEAKLERKKDRLLKVLQNEKNYLERSISKEVEQMKVRHEKEFADIIEQAERRAIGKAKTCSCPVDYICTHNKSASFNTRKPHPQVVQYRSNARRLKRGGRIEDALMLEEKAAEIDDHYQNAWRENIANAIVSSPWGANVAQVDLVIENHKKEEKIMEETHRCKRAELRSSTRRRYWALENNMNAERQRLKIKVKKLYEKQLEEKVRKEHEEDAKRLQNLANGVVDCIDDDDDYNSQPYDNLNKVNEGFHQTRSFTTVKSDVTWDTEEPIQNSNKYHREGIDDELMRDIYGNDGDETSSVNNVGTHEDEDEYIPFENLHVTKWDDEDDLNDALNDSQHNTGASFGNMTMEHVQMTSGLSDYVPTPSPPSGSRPNTTGSFNSALKSNLKSPNAQKRTKGTVSFSSVASNSDNKTKNDNTFVSNTTPVFSPIETEKLAKHLESTWTGEGAIRVVSINGQMLEAKKDVVKVESERAKVPSPPTTSPSSKGSFRTQSASPSTKKVQNITTSESKQAYPIHHNFNTASGSAAYDDDTTVSFRPGSLRDEDYVEREKELGNGMVSSYCPEYPDVTMAVQDLMNRYNNRVAAK